MMKEGCMRLEFMMIEVLGSWVGVAEEVQRTNGSVFGLFAGLPVVTLSSKANLARSREPIRLAQLGEEKVLIALAPRRMTN